MSRKSSRGVSGIFFSVVAVGVVAMGIGYWMTHQPAGKPDVHVEPPQTQSAPSTAVEAHKRVKIYVMELKKDDVDLVPVERTVPTGKDPCKTALDRLIATNHESGPSQHLIPKGTKVLGLEIKDGVAYPNFSKELVNNFDGGQSSEELLVGSIVQTLTQFSDVKKVQILVDGKEIDSIGGHLDLSAPLTRDSVVPGQGEDN